LPLTFYYNRSIGQVSYKKRGIEVINFYELVIRYTNYLVFLIYEF
jgi:hypothetical protein